MSDEEQLAADDEGYTNLDLETAEQLVIAAGHPNLAPALTAHAQGVRNLVQGEWGKSFVASLDTLLSKHIRPLMDAQKETQSGVAALGDQFRTLAESVSQLEGDTEALRRGQLDLMTRIENDEARLDQKRQRLDDHDRQIAELRAIITERQRLRPIEYEQLADAIVARLKAHGDGDG